MNKLRVAHFSIPFYNSGGLIKYLKDVVNYQQGDKNIEYVCVFYPANYTVCNSEPSIKYKNNDGLDIYEVNNFSPTTLLEGTKYPEQDIYNKKLEDIIIDKIDKLNINIAHFHTFHGFTSNLIKKIKERNIKIIYTAHDYQPICNRINLLNYKDVYCDNLKLKNCFECNSHSLSKTKLKVRYSKVGNILKSNEKIKSFIKNIVVRLRNKEEKIEIDDNKLYDTKLNSLYLKRTNEYVENFNKYVDEILVSSNITKNIFIDYGIESGKIKLLPVSNQLIKNKLKNYKVDINYNEKVTFGYVGGSRREKGYSIMISAFEKLKISGVDNWELKLYGSGAENIQLASNIANNVKREGHTSKVPYEDFQVLIVPSIWPETFNFATIEGISNKKLVITSNIVGSGDLLKENGVITYKYNDENDLYETLKSVILNKCIYDVNIESNKIIDLLNFDSHYKYLISLYNK